MRKLIHHMGLLAGLFFLLFPVLFFQSQYVVVNFVTELPVLVIFNLVLLVFFVEQSIRKYQYQSIFLLIIAAVAVFSSFFRIIPLPIGITLAFLLPICSGVVFGPSFGFVIGQLSMIVGGIFLGAFGPWMPYQSFLMGVIGYYAGFFFYKQPRSTSRTVMVILYAVLMSFFYGYWMSVTYWPVAVKDVMVPEDGYGKLRMYSEYYMLTSLFWDFTRSVGNIIVFAAFLNPTCELLERSKVKLTYYKK